MLKLFEDLLEVVMENNRNVKWKELSSQRMSRILQTVELVANLSSINYEYEDEWLKFLLEAYFSKGQEIRKVFENPETVTEQQLLSEFTFPDIGDFDNLTRKQEKFIEVGQRRMTNLYKEMNNFSRLANKKNYTYDQVDVEYLFDLYDEKGVELRKWFPPYKNERVSNDVVISNYPSEA